MQPKQCNLEVVSDGNLYYKHMSVFMVFAFKQVNINKNSSPMHDSACGFNTERVCMHKILLV